MRHPRVDPIAASETIWAVRNWRCVLTPLDAPGRMMVTLLSSGHALISDSCRNREAALTVAADLLERVEHLI